jgi:hypothetical protein
MQDNCLGVDCLYTPAQRSRRAANAGKKQSNDICSSVNSLPGQLEGDTL